jgi:hypothetical protein
MKAEALYLADRTSEALEAIKEAEALVERFEERWWCAELHRLRAVFLTAMGADETQIEASFCAATRIAKEQKSVSLKKRAKGSYLEYRRKKRARQRDVGFDYLFANPSSQLPRLRSKARLWDVRRNLRSSVLQFFRGIG